MQYNKYQKKEVVYLTNKTRILLVDDEEDIVLLIKKGLENRGCYNVVIYIDPLKALNDFKPNSYDLVMIDIRMPQMNGFEFYSSIKKMKYHSKVCFFSASENTEEEIKNMYPELKKYSSVLIRKPIGIKDMIIIISGILNTKNQKQSICF